MTRRICLIALFPMFVFAQEKRALTIDEAIRLGLENSTLMHIAEAKATAADAKSREVNATRLPSLRVQASYTRLSDVGPFAVQLPSAPAPFVISPAVLDQYTSKVSLQQPLFSGFRLERSSEAAEYSATAADFDVERDKASVIFNITMAYWSVYKATEVKHVVDETVRQIKAHLADVENMMVQGLATRNEVLKVDVQLSNAQLLQIESANNVKTTTMSLNNLIGLPLDTDIRITSTIQTRSDQLRSPENLAEHALLSRADIKATEMRVNAAEASLSAAKGGWWPQLNLYANLSYSRPSPRVLPTKDEFRDTWDVGVSLSWDLWNWGTTKHQSDQARAAHAQVRSAFQQMKNDVSLEIHQGYLALAQSKEKISVTSKGVHQAEENYRLTKNKFSSGTATNTELLDAEVALLQTKLNSTVSLVDYELAHAKLAKALGREL